MLPGEQCLSVLTPDQGILLCPKTFSSSAAAAAAAAGADHYLNLDTGGLGMGSSTSSSSGRSIYLQLTNFRCILKFIGDEGPLSLPYAAIQEVTAETVSGSKISVCGPLFSRTSASSSSPSVQYQQQQQYQSVAASGGGGGGGAMLSAVNSGQQATAAMQNAAGQVLRFFSGSATGSKQQQQPPPLLTPTHASGNATPVSGSRTPTADALSLPPPQQQQQGRQGAEEETEDEDRSNSTLVFHDAAAAAEKEGRARASTLPSGPFSSRTEEEEGDEFDVVGRGEFDPHSKHAQRQLLLRPRAASAMPSGGDYDDDAVFSPLSLGSRAVPASSSPSSAIHHDAATTNGLPAHASTLTRLAVKSVRIVSLHGWSWQLVDPAATTYGATTMGGMSQPSTPAPLEPNFLGNQTFDNVNNQQQQQQSFPEEARGLNRFVNELSQIVTLLGQAPELFTTVTCAAAAAKEQKKESPSSPSLSFSSASPLLVPPTVSQEEMLGHHIYSAKKDLERMLGAAYFRSVSMSNSAAAAAAAASLLLSASSSGGAPLPSLSNASIFSATSAGGFLHGGPTSTQSIQLQHAMAATASSAEGLFAVQRLDHASSRFATYPLEVIVPSSVDQRLLLEASHCRAHGRVPVISWLCPHRRVVLARSSQPLVTGQWNADADVKLVQHIRRSFSSGSASSSSSSSDSPQLIVFDFRSRQAATANLALGGGYETQSRYGKIDLVFLDLPNIHAITSEFEKLRERCHDAQRFSLGGDHPLLCAARQSSSVADDMWSKLRRKLIRASCQIALTLDSGKSVLAHCTDGWDRTPACIALAKMILDSHFRTVSGFCELVECDWLQFGHRMADRNVGPVPHQLSSAAVASATYAQYRQNRQQHQSTTTTSSSSPPASPSSTDLPDWCRYTDIGEHGEGEKPKPSCIFFQFLDAVRELVEMFPSRFEYTSSLLTCMLHAAYSAEHGTFCFNTHRQRVHPVNGVTHRTLSFWTEISRAVQDEVLSVGDDDGAADDGGYNNSSNNSSFLRMAETPGLDGIPLVNPIHRPALRRILLSRQQQQQQQNSGGGSGEEEAGTGGGLLFGNQYHQHLSRSTLSPVDDGTILVPIFEAFGTGGAVWSSWLNIAPKWNRFNDASFNKIYCVTACAGRQAIHTGEHIDAALAREIQQKRKQQQNGGGGGGGGGTIPAVLRLFPDAEKNVERHRQLFLQPASSAHLQQQDSVRSPQSAASRAAAAARFADPDTSGGGGQSGGAAETTTTAAAEAPPLAAQFANASSAVPVLSPDWALGPPPQHHRAGAGAVGGSGGSSPGSLTPSLGPQAGSMFPSAPQELYLPLREREDSDACSNCQKSFSIFNRRHTCRMCTRSFCNSCCSKFAVVAPGLVRDREAREALYKNPGDKVRLCDSCFWDAMPG